VQRAEEPVAAIDAKRCPPVEPLLDHGELDHVHRMLKRIGAD
jgi:hypothetical protein